MTVLVLDCHGISIEEAGLVFLVVKEVVVSVIEDLEPANKHILVDMTTCDFEFFAISIHISTFEVDEKSIF